MKTIELMNNQFHYTERPIQANNKYYSDGMVTNSISVYMSRLASRACIEYTVLTFNSQ